MTFPAFEAHSVTSRIVLQALTFERRVDPPAFFSHRHGSTGFLLVLFTCHVTSLPPVGSVPADPECCKNVLRLEELFLSPKAVSILTTFGKLSNFRSRTFRGFPRTFRLWYWISWSHQGVEGKGMILFISSDV